MSTAEEMRKERFGAVKDRLAQTHDGPWTGEEVGQALDDLAWLASELTGAANGLRRLEMELKMERESNAGMRERYSLEQERWRQWHKWHNREMGRMSAKIGQARGEAALARERLRAMVRRMHEERR